MSKFLQAYSQMRPTLELAADRLQSLLLAVVGRIEDPKLVRVKLGGIRLKAPASLERKAREAGWTPDQALSLCPDLVGARVVCNNVEDVYRFEALLREYLPFEPGPVKRQDYIRSPKYGYRALHLNFRLNVGEHIIRRMVPCEVQIRSRLQDAWAELSHADFYKHDDLPPDLLARAEDLSLMLAATEEIAGEIRARVRRVTEPPEKQPSLGRVTADGMAYIFNDVFGRPPANYVVAMALSIARELHISKLGELPAILKRQGFRNKLDQAYREMLPFPIDSESVLLAGLHALAADEGAAQRYVREQAKAALDEIDDIATRELLSGLPATAEQLIDEIDDPNGETDVAMISAALGVADNCTNCNATVVDPVGFSEAAILHYGLSGDEADRACERIQESVVRSSADIGAFDEPNACSHCAATLRKAR